MRLLAALLCLLFASPAWAGKVALVLGNGNYLQSAQLRNAPNDARDFAARLRDLGFEVFEGVDLTRQQSLALVQDFARALSFDDTALFFFAGHGMQLGGDNYILPIDAVPGSEVSLTESAIRLQSILSTMENSANTRIIILDACRNNPYLRAGTSRGTSENRGLMKMEAGVGSFIAFATEPGNVAADGTGRNSPFTTALLRHIGTPGADIHAVMRAVRGEVIDASNSTQVPWENSSLISEVFLTSSASAAPAPAPAPAAVPLQTIAPVPAPPQPQPQMVPVSVHFVSGLDPNGDGFLALREGTTAGSRRLDKMVEGTLLQVLSKGNPWWYVRTQSGQQGYAHSNWIACCKTALVPAATASSAVPQAPPPATAMPLTRQPQSCEELWYARNLIWHRNGYCFSTDRAISAFGNDNCRRGQNQSNISLSPADRAEVDRLVALESQSGCR